MQQINKFFNEIKKEGYHDVIVDEENSEFLIYLENKDIDKKSLNHDSLDKHWYACFNHKLSEYSLNKKIKLFTSEHINWKIKFLDILPVINDFSTTILIKKDILNEFQKYWHEFQDVIFKSTIAPDRLCKSDFKIDENYTYETILKIMPTLDEGNKKRYRQKKIFYLFFLFLTSKQKTLLPSLYIMSEDTFFNYSSSLNILVFFGKKHYFYTKPINKNLIDDELNINKKAKLINYIRFSYLMNYDRTLLTELKNEDIAVIMNILRNSTRSEKMISVYENPIRKVLYWLGAININQTKREADIIINTPIEILHSIENIDKRYIKIFYPYFSEKPTNDEQRKNARYIKSFIIFLDYTLPELNVENLTKFFSTTIAKKNDSSEPELNSQFLDYLQENVHSVTLADEIQKIVFQSFGNYHEFRSCFLISDLKKIYRMPNNRKIARLALDRRILTKMKEICIFNPIIDNYYIPTHIDKRKYSWKHFDKSEPQLPVMFFLYLSMPWRKEHIISMDRDNFLKKDENDELLEVQITTDKNQNNNFVIEKEFFEHAISFKDSKGENHCPLELITQTIEYVKESFPLLAPLYRKDNKVWGKIKPILCRNSAYGFLPDYIFNGYYYKVFLQALLELKYPSEKIKYFIQLSKKGLEQLGDYSKIYSSLNDMTIFQSSKFFSSTNFSPHSIRKSNITYLVSDKKSLEFIIKLSGHKALSTVLGVYIDYDMLNRLNITERGKTSISNNFREMSRVGVRKIIENFQKFHFINMEDIKEKLSNENLFFSPLILAKNQILQVNDSTNLQILEPSFWEELTTGICTNALNCEKGRENKCSICPYFLTGHNFIDSINSKVMQLSSRTLEYYNIILKHVEDEKLSGKEAIIYQDEVQLTLAELEGYSAILNKINTSLYELIGSNLSSADKKNLPAKQDMVIVKYEHMPYLKAQLEVYKCSKQFTDHNLEIEHSIEILYSKILDMILLGDIPRNLFIETISDKEAAIERFLELLNNGSDLSIQNVQKKYLLL